MASELPARERNVLVVINEPVNGRDLRAAIGDDSVEARVHLVAPAFEPRIGRGRAAAAAQRRLRRCLAELGRVGVGATGAVGDPEALKAIEDSLREFPADEIVIASNPGRLGRRLGENFPERAVDRFRLPVAHLALGGPAAA
jgi:hypothetical protein